MKKYAEEGLPFPIRRHPINYSLGELLALRYFEKQVIESFQEKNKCLELNRK